MDKRYTTPIIGALVGAFLFVLIYGVSFLNPTYVDWLISPFQDSTQHYVGWMAYRNSNWFFPWGLTDQLMSPLKTSLIYTDSIPLLAVPFKLLSPILPATFQYFGLWGLMCYMLNGALSSLIVRKITGSKIKAIIGSVLFILTYPMIFRTFVHSSLAGQWLILLALCGIVFYDHLKGKKAVVFWIVLGILSTSVHMYFLLMNGIILLGFITKDFIQQRRFYRPFVFLGSYVIPAAINLVCLGAFSTAMGYEAGGYWLYSLNFNSFFNNLNFGMFGNHFEVCQYSLENMTYLGMGIILLLIPAIIVWVRSINIKKSLPYIIPGFVALIFALSPTWTIGQKELFTIPLPGIALKAWSIFRASGRVAWVCIYLLILFAVCMGTRYKRQWIGYVVLAIAISIQMLDVSVALNRRVPLLNFDNPYESSLDVEPLEEFLSASGTTNLDIIPDWDYDLYDFVILAANNGISVNNFAFSRAEELTNMLRDQALETMAKGDSNTAFIFRKTDTMLCPSDLYYYDLGDFLLGSSYSSDILPRVDSTGLNTFSYSGIPHYLNDGEYDEATDTRTLHAGGVSFGPYIDMNVGQYEIVIEGTNLDALELNPHFTGRDGSYIPCTIASLDTTNDSLTIIICVDSYNENFELTLTNQSEEDVNISMIEISKISE